MATPPNPALLTALIARVGRGLRLRLQNLGSLARLTLLTLHSLLRLKPRHLPLVLTLTRQQCRFTALDALPLTCFTALLLGGVTLLQVYGSWSGLGAEATLSRLLARLVIRELGPLLVGVIVISRSGTAIAAELASMRLNSEIDALRTLGIQPAQYLYLPRLLGGMLSTFCLVVCFDTVALLGGFALAWIQRPLSLQAYLEALTVAVGAPELALTFMKSLLFGAAIPLLSIQSGLKVQHSSTEVPQAVTRAAVSALVTVFLVGAVLSAVFYG